MEKFKSSRYLNWETEGSNALVVRLERNQQNLQQLRSQMNSYLSEPKTHSLYERVEQLRRAIERCSRNNYEVIAHLKEKREPKSIHVDRAKKQLTVFRVLRASVEEYMAKCAEGELQTS